MKRITSWLREWRPSEITGGAPFFPLLVLFGLNSTEQMDRAAFGVLVPEIREYFRLDVRGILIMVSLVAVAMFVLQIPIAYLADRWSRVRIATIGAAVWVAFSALTGLAPSVIWLAVARVGSGLGTAVITPTHYSLIADYYEVEARPKAYGLHRAAYSLGLFLGPAVGGVIAFNFGWRVPFVIFALPTIVFVFLATRLSEPVRGGMERRYMGAADDVVHTEEAPPSMAEGWRLLWQIRSLRRIWYSLPFLAAAFFGLASLLSIYYEQIFGLDEAQRGLLFAFVQIAGVVGVFAALPLANRLVARDPGLSVKFLAAIVGATAVLWLAFILSPSLPVSVVGQFLIDGLLAVVTPVLLAVLSLAIPPRARSLGFTVGGLWYVPGLVLLVSVGALADSWGIREAMTLMIPILVVGAVIIWSAAPFLAADIDRVRTSSVGLAEVAAARERGEVKLLLVRNLDVGYDGVQVLFGVNLEVGEGEIVALLGTNGAGKSTLLKAISGLVEAQAGAVIFDGRDMTFVPPHEGVPRGIVQVPGGRGVFPTLSVGENLKIAGWLHRRDPDYINAATTQVLGHFPILKDRWDQAAGDLSGGEQQMLTLGMAFIAKPRLLMIDELSLGLAPAIVEQLLGIVKAFREQGTTIILVEQSVNVALTVAETAYFMEKGEIRFHGPTRKLLERPDVVRSVFLEGAGSVVEGNGRRTPRRRIKSTTGRRRRSRTPVLEVRELQKSFGGVTAVTSVSFALDEGEILGIIGPNGAGKTTVFDLISGVVPPDDGTVILLGRDITNASADVRARFGLGRSFQDARLFPALTVAETISVALERSVASKDPLAAALGLPGVARSEAQVSKRVGELIDLMHLGAFADKFVSELSTGSRRIVDLACALAHEPKVLLFDEPSSGIAQRESEALGPLLRRIRDATGASLLVIEHDIPLVISVADEVIALDLGKVVTRGRPHDVLRHPEVIASYLGTSEQVIARSGKLGRRKRRGVATASGSKSR